MTGSDGRKRPSGKQGERAARNVGGRRGRLFHLVTARPILTSATTRPTFSRRPLHEAQSTRGNAMDLIADRGRRVSIEELNTTRLLAHARRQADERNLDGVLIVDVDSHHYENECYDEFLPFIANEVLRQLVLAGPTKGPHTFLPPHTTSHALAAPT